MAHEDSLFLLLDCECIKKACSIHEGENLINFITQKLEEVRGDRLDELIKIEPKLEAQKKSIIKSFKRKMTNLEHVKNQYKTKDENAFNFMAKSQVSNLGVKNNDKKDNSLLKKSVTFASKNIKS